ncbi:hypothetical protein HBI49_140010 [Parastagonospora nodorum]|nr:hypothetical protein HBI95_160840 [Parastagonospora nodorum]KAH5073018.1 hypothetical protein HBH95_160470 [Parastagonospora nodorum]KAH5358924.1 hypothetical protein HBI49_140010 [Parastagonospora nodorum]KAH5486297.1 hypothetical protein HBI31_153200 [Parastagonospora nodorum]KAH6121870.1 hypothetical protein HBI64_161690 [Parastagonospora nodorum]
MEVDAASFPHRLLGLFIHISEADFVSFDLELSGIPSRLPNKPRSGAGRFTLEERYAEAKEGANRYQILQVGITCARFDYIANKYVLRPYNINISPLISERVDFEREISLQSGAITFLLGCGFDMAKPFTHGVEYLSRQEAEQIKQATADRLENKNPPADMQLKDTDVDSLDFMRRVREAIIKWKAGTSESLAITTHTGLKEQPAIPTISRFEKRLVHQLVRAEYPELVSMGRSECVRIINFDPLREADNNRRIKSRVKEQVNRQSGFRWVFEALAQGNLDHAEPLYVAGNITADSHNVRDRYDRAVERLRTRQPVLVGHNMFTDIVYLYRTFVGELPDTLQGFRDAIHKEFPKIVDTKYLATHAEGDLNASPTLQEIAEGLTKQPLPDIVTHTDHSKYQEKEAFHEAGYDSLLTATIMIRLAAKLGAEHEKKHPSNIAPLTNGAKNTNGDLEDFIRDGREKAQKPVALPPLADISAVTGRQKRKQKKKVKSKEATDRRAKTKNMFDNLRDLSLDPEADEAASPESEPAIDFEDAEAWKGEPAAEAGSWENELFVQDKSGWVPIEQSERHVMEMIPKLDGDSAFWKEFGNTLRVFGTQEAVLKIADW